KAAEDHIAKNQPLVPHIAIAIADPAPGTKLVIDDDSYPIDQVNNVPIDPGPHHIVVSAPGRVSYETTVTMEQSKPAAIAVPKLAYPVTVKRGRQTLGMVFTFVGAGVFLSAEGLAFYARYHYRDQIDMGHCSNEPTPKCDAYGSRETDRAL